MQEVAGVSTKHEGGGYSEGSGASSVSLEAKPPKMSAHSAVISNPTAFGGSINQAAALGRVIKGEGMDATTAAGLLNVIGGGVQAMRPNGASGLTAVGVWPYSGMAEGGSTGVGSYYTAAQM